MLIADLVGSIKKGHASPNATRLLDNLIRFDEISAIKTQPVCVTTSF
jgi:hypothetical protein